MNTVSFPKASGVRELPESLRHALQPALVQAVLDVRWAWPGNRGLRLEQLQVHRVFPRGRNGFVIKYRARLQGAEGPQETDLFGEITGAEVFGERQRILEKLRKSRRKQVERDHDSDAIAAVPELEMLLRVPGYDERIPGLLLRHQPRKANVFLQEQLQAFPGGGRPRFTILNHRLGKRCVLRVAWRERDGKRSAVLRCLKEKDRRHRQNQADMERLWLSGFDRHSADGIRIPRVLGCDDRLRTLIIEEVPGVVLGETERWPQAYQASLAGAALAKLHTCPPWLDRCHGVDQELGLLEEWVALATRLRPDLAELLQQNHGQVIRRLEACRGREPRLAHRDFYNKQLLHDGRRTTLIDFDTLCLADPALDMGNYLAHRHLARLTGEPWDEDETRAFLDAYGEAAALPAAWAIGAWQHAALLRLACLYATHTGWEAVPAALLAQAETPPS